MSNSTTSSKKVNLTIDMRNDEFKPDAITPPDVDSMSPVSRRKFLALVGATSALAATSCTDYRDKGQIISYNKKPEYVTYGAANFYASTYRDGSPILIKTREGRPIGVVGNPEHPKFKGKASIQSSSSLLDLYDPERLKKPTKSGSPTAWKVVDDEIISTLKSAANSGGEIAILCNEVKSPTVAKLFNDFKLAYPTSEFYPLALFNDSNRREAWKLSYKNDGNYPMIQWNKAKVIVCVEADILGREGRTIEQIKGYAEGRNIDDPKNFNRLYAIEADLSLTGMNADYRMAVNPIKSYSLLAAIYNELVEKLSPMGVTKINAKSLDDLVAEYKLNRKVLNTLVNDLLNGNGKSVVYGGDALSMEYHVLINAINELIGASALYDYSDRTVSFFEVARKEKIESLVGKMNSGKVKVAIVLDTNPSYFLASDYGFDSALSKVPTRVSFSEKETETSALCNYVLPCNHPYESWGDYQDNTAVVNLRQPVIDPLYDTRQIESEMLVWMGGSSKSYKYDIYYDFLRANWQNTVYTSFSAELDFTDFWNAALHNGFLSLSAQNPTEKFDFAVLGSLNKPADPNGLTVILAKNYYIGDGRYAGNGWLQEIPHPVSKVFWDNYVSISPTTAKKLGLNYKSYNSDIIEITVSGRKLKCPIIPQPGVAEDCMTIELGYGRTKAGTIGNDVGVDAVALMSKNSSYGAFIYTGASISKTGDTYKVFTSQEHHSLEDNFVKDFHRVRNIIQDGTVAQYIKNPEFIQEKSLLSEKEIEEHSVNPPHDYSNVKWAMAIDLNRCIACGNCVSSCNAENNIPVVGKEESGHGREMHWMRIDRYYSGDDANPIVSNQPMLCQHCDMAPCENVCPVVATTHSIDGLNQMTYNRCVGTRYCANNCPYKVRRFNFFDFRNWYKDAYYESDSFELIHNPEVTVRSRGVMEKCTFCVQRITEGRQESTKLGEKFDGSGIKTACQEACPSDAIVFGNINDPNSAVSKISNSKLGYKVLEILAVKPNITYIAKLRNVNEEEAV